METSAHGVSVIPVRCKCAIFTELCKESPVPPGEAGRSQSVKQVSSAKAQQAARLATWSDSHRLKSLRPGLLSLLLLLPLYGYNNTIITISTMPTFELNSSSQVAVVVCFPLSNRSYFAKVSVNY